MHESIIIMYDLPQQGKLGNGQRSLRLAPTMFNIFLVLYGMVWYGMVCMYVCTCMHDSHTLLQCSENDPASDI